MPAAISSSAGRLPLWVSVGIFILRAPARMEQMDLALFLARVALEPRHGFADFRRVSRIMRRWLRLPGLRRRNTCYLRSLVYFRFVNATGRDLCLHFGIDEEIPGERLHGHAWVSLDGAQFNAPESYHANRIREIYRFSTVQGGSSSAGAAFAAALFGGEKGAPAASGGTALKPAADALALPERLSRPGF